MASFKTVAGMKAAHYWVGARPVPRRSSLPHIDGRLPHQLFVLVPSALSEYRHTFHMTTAEHFSGLLQAEVLSLCV